MDPRPVLKLFGGAKAYRGFVLDGLGEGHREEYYEVEDQRFLGSEEFGEKVRAEVEEKSERGVKKRPLGKVIEELARRWKVSAEALRRPDRSWRLSRLRTLMAYVLVRHGGFKVGETAAYFGRDRTTISSLISRYSEKARRDPEVMKELERLARFV
jgi:chromosomal replication initiation ATPase DnaA